MTVEQLRVFVTRRSRVLEALRKNQATCAFHPIHASSGSQGTIGKEAQLLPGGRWLFSHSNEGLYLWDLENLPLVSPVATFDLVSIAEGELEDSSSLPKASSTASKFAARWSAHLSWRDDFTVSVMMYLRTQLVFPPSRRSCTSLSSSEQSRRPLACLE